MSFFQCATFPVFEMSNTIKNHLASNENGNDDSEMSENVNVALNLEVHPERQPYSTNPEGIEEALKYEK